MIFDIAFARISKFIPILLHWAENNELPIIHMTVNLLQIKERFVLYLITY